MQKIQFHKVQPGERIKLPIVKGKVGWSIKCCDCALEHVLLFEPHKTYMLVGAWRRDDIPILVLPKKHYKKQK